MPKTQYKGNYSKEELKELELDRKERLLELQKYKNKDTKRRKARTNRHVDWSEPLED